jgi:transcriptional regulator with XRE-family HTH domain
MEMKNNKTLAVMANTIKRLRKKQGLTQRDLAAAIGADASHLSRIESGNHGITLEMLDKLANALGVYSYELLEHVPVDELNVEHKVKKLESLPPIKRKMVEQMIDAFLRERESL